MMEIEIVDDEGPDQTDQVLEYYKKQTSYKDVDIEVLESQLSLSQDRIEELEFLLERVSEVSKKYLRHLKNLEQYNQELMKENEELIDRLAELSKRR